MSTPDIEAEFRAWRFSAAGSEAGIDWVFPERERAAKAAYLECARQAAGREGAERARVRGLVEATRESIEKSGGWWPGAHEKVTALLAAIDAGPAVAEVALCGAVLWPDSPRASHPCVSGPGHPGPHKDKNGSAWTDAAKEPWMDAAPAPAAPAPSVVKVRIAIAVSASGEWEAVGTNAASDQWMSDRAASKFCRGVQTVVHWVEAEVPIPVSATVAGKVVTK